MHRKDAHALVTQAAFLFNANQEMLILQLPDNRWQLPGGKLQRAETWTEGLHREIFEETGIEDIEIVRVLYVDNWYTVANDYYRAYFLCTTMNDEVLLSNDHNAYQWINSETDLSSLVFTHETVREHIKNLFAQL
jgi:ADP-ribose pyrophosphatase YjhB (NUDIX family)